MYAIVWRNFVLFLVFSVFLEVRDLLHTFHYLFKSENPEINLSYEWIKTIHKMKGLFSFCNIGVLSRLCVYLRKYEILSTNLSKLYNQIYIDISIISIFRLRICDTECNMKRTSYLLLILFFVFMLMSWLVVVVIVW
jgi:hypothetical protein